MAWIAAGPADLAPETARRFDHGGRTYALFRDAENGHYCTDGLCTHEDVHLADGLVMDTTVECPKHASIFDFATGDVQSPPACNNLRCYPAKVEAGQIWVDL
jgi:3-phenylpropionate/trans-cinnamate dioxygenase ferredoxin component